MVRLLLTVVATLLLLVVVRWSQPDALRVDGFWSLAAVALVTAAGAALTLRLSRVLFTRLAPWVRGVLSTAVAFALVASFTGDFGPVVIVGAVLLALSLLFSLLRGGTLRAEPFPPDMLAVGRLAGRFAVPALWYLAAVAVVPGVQSAQRWPGALLGGIVAGGTLVTGAVLAFTRPWHAAVTPVTVDGAVRAAYGGLGHLVGIGDPHTGADLRVMGSSGVLLDLAGFLPDPTPDAVRRQAGRLTPGLVRALCAVETPQRTLLASAGYGEAVHLWDPATGKAVRALAGHLAPVNALCVVPVDGTVLLASGGGERGVRIWDPEAGRQVRMIGHGVRAGVQALCTVARDDGGRALLAAAYTDGGIRVWDPVDGRPILQIAAHSSSVNALCTGTVDGAGWLASAANDGTVRLWDLVTGKALGSFDDSSPRYALCPVELDGEVLVAAAGDGVGISLFDPATRTRRGSLGTGPVLQMLLNPRPTGWIRSMCQVGSGDDAFLMFAGYDRAVGQIRLRPALQALA
ncbi:WD40 repeat domain-containing protein [Micromonospora haikouensis]|uniref:WD40 repeat domain-containing protein n=1 Tax=Micromonospora haikouensis TaxID=686309 RepID=UPI0037AE2CED